VWTASELKQHEDNCQTSPPSSAASPAPKRAKKVTDDPDDPEDPDDEPQAEVMDADDDVSQVQLLPLMIVF